MVATQPLSAPPEAAEHGPQHFRDAEPPGPPQLLVVDDSATARLHFRKILTGAGLGAVIHEAPDGKAALQLALKEPLDCVLCDLNMPGMDGLGFLRVVRQHRSRLELPILILTAMDGPTERVTCLRLGASDFIVKPPEPVELVARTEIQVQLARMHRQLQFLSERDPLTGLINRRVFLDHLRRETQRGARNGDTAALLVVDVDRLKTINEQHGQLIGDSVLRDLADLLRRMVRPYDVVGRLGGQEFGLLLPQVDEAGARTVAERVLNRVRASSLGGLPRRHVTVSVGGALAFPPAQAEPWYALAAACMDAAKRHGGDRLVW